MQVLEWELIVGNTNKGNFDLQIRPQVGKTDLDGYTFDLFHSKSSRNRINCNVPEMDQLMLEARQTLDPNKRKALYDEIQRMVLDYNHQYFFYNMNEVDVLQPYVKGFKQSPSKSRFLPSPPA